MRLCCSGGKEELGKHSRLENRTFGLGKSHRSLERERVSQLVGRLRPKSKERLAVEAAPTG